MRGEPSTSSSVMLSVLCEVSSFLVSFSPAPSQSHLVLLSASFSCLLSLEEEGRELAWSPQSSAGRQWLVRWRLVPPSCWLSWQRLVISSWWWCWRTHYKAAVLALFWRTLLADFFFLFLQQLSWCVAGLGSKTSLKTWHMFCRPCTRAAETISFPTSIISGGSLSRWPTRNLPQSHSRLTWFRFSTRSFSVVLLFSFMKSAILF